MLDDTSIWPGPGRTSMPNSCWPCWVDAGIRKGSARPFPSEPEDPQGEEGVAARASRHENAEALILLHSSHIFIQSSVTREGVSRGTRGGDTPPAPPRRGTTQVGVPLH